jgi:hypothetical protein
MTGPDRRPDAWTDEPIWAGRPDGQAEAVEPAATGAPEGPAGGPPAHAPTARHGTAVDGSSDSRSRRAPRPVRWWTVVVGVVVPTVAFTGFEGGLTAALLRQEETAGLTTLLFWLPLGILLLAVATILAGAAVLRVVDRGLGIGLLVGCVTGLLTGAAVCVAVLRAGTGIP